MSDYAQGVWEEISFDDIHANDWLAIVTRATTDAPEPDEDAISVIRVTVEDEDIIYRWKPEAKEEANE